MTDVCLICASKTFACTAIQVSDMELGWFLLLQAARDQISKDLCSNKGIASSNKCLTSRNKKLLGAPGRTTRSQNATRNKCVTKCYQLQTSQPLKCSSLLTVMANACHKMHGISCVGCSHTKSTCSLVSTFSQVY